MTTTNGFSNITATSATLNMSDAGANGTLDVQIAVRPDFEFCVCPIFNVARASTVDLPGLNQRTNYFVRTRNRSAVGAVEGWSATEGFRTLDGSGQTTSPAAVMIEPAIFVVPAPVVEVQQRSQLSGFPLTNMFRDSPAAARMIPTAQTTGQPDRYVIDFRTAGAPVDTIALLNTNLPESARWFVQAGAVFINDDSANVQFSTSSAAFRASPNLPQRPGYHGLLRISPARSFNWWRIVIDATLPGGILHIEHAIVGLNRTSKNHSVEKQESPAPLTTLERKRSGIPDRVRGRPMRSVDFELNMLSEAQYETIYGDLWRYELEPVLVVPNSKSGAFLHDRILYGDLSGGRTVNPTSPRYNRSFTVRSLV